MKRGRRVSRQDVAKAAGVSPTTVTHALNPVAGARMAEETRLRVQRVARELGYRPSFVGRALVEGRSYAVGLLQPSHDSLFYGFYQAMMRGMVRAMEPDDYHLLVLFRSEERRYLKVVRQGRVDGLLVLQSDFDTAHIESVIATGVPTVVVNKAFPVARHAAAGCVHSDHRGMVRQAVAELAQHGCRSLLLIDDFRACDANAQMAEAFSAEVAARAARGLVGTTLVPDTGNLDAQMRNAFAAGQRWDGIITDGAPEAATVLAEARRAGLVPGRDLHLVSTDFLPGRATHDREALCTYTQQPDHVGAEAWRLLRALINRESVDAHTVLVPYSRDPATSGSATGGLP